MSIWRGRLGRWRALAELGVAMMVRDQTKLAGSLAGVFFACLLTAQQAGTLSSLVGKNTMLVDHAGADVWVMPFETEQIIATSTLDRQALLDVRALPGVTWAEPLYFVGGSIVGPDGSSEALSLIGYDTRSPNFAPWFVAQGDVGALTAPGTVVLEDSQRELLAGVNLGSLREINGQLVQVVAFTRGLLPFGPSYGFTDAATALSLAGRTDRDPSFVLVRVAPGVDADALAETITERGHGALRARSSRQFRLDAVLFLFSRTPIGITFGTAMAFGLVVGCVIVALTMLSAVVDNLREFGMLKAIGAGMSDLAVILAVQAVGYGVLGGFLGISSFGLLADLIRSPTLDMQLPTFAVLGLPLGMIVLCLVASILSLWRLRGVEPAMVFR